MLSIFTANEWDFLYEMYIQLSVLEMDCPLEKLHKNVSSGRREPIFVSTRLSADIQLLKNGAASNCVYTWSYLSKHELLRLYFAFDLSNAACLASVQLLYTRLESEDLSVTFAFSFSYMLVFNSRV